MSHDVSWTHVKGPEHCSNADMDQDTMYMYILYTSVKIIKNEVGCRDDTVPKTVETRRHCEDLEHATIFRNPLPIHLGFICNRYQPTCTVYIYYVQCVM